MVLSTGRKLLTIAQGKKTYAAVIVGVLLGIANYLGYHEPHWMDLLLAAAGLGALRASVASQTTKTAVDIMALVMSTVGSNE